MQLGKPEPKQCERCGTQFVSVHVKKRFCTEKCERRAGEQRRRKARAAERRAAKAAQPKACKDCATTAGMDWWVGRMQHPGSASARCHDCYLLYWHNAHARRMAAKGVTVRPYRKRGEPKPKRAPSRQSGSVAECSVCGVSFMRGKHQTSLKVCGEACRAVNESAKNRRKNAKRKAAKVGDPYTIADVVKRDGNKCHLCGKRVNMSLPGTDRMGPTVDHLLPIAAGGLDELANVRLAHRSCNCSRGTRGIVQLMMVG